MPPKSCSWTMTTGSRRPLKALTLLALSLILTACAPRGGGLPADALDDGIARAIGDPATCVVISEKATGKILYRYNTYSACARALPACDRPGTLTLEDSLKLAQDQPRTTSCASLPDNSRAVSWAAGPVPGPRGLAYAAYMEGTRNLPGMVIRDKLEALFARLGLDKPKAD